MRDVMISDRYIKKVFDDFEQQKIRRLIFENSI
jgi:hypothetical protein